MKKATHREYSKSINVAIDYINAHLHEAIDLKTIAEVANISEYHFHRIFKAYIGESLGAYISRIRLENTALNLQISNKPLIEIADKSGYESPPALSKAFKKHFGLSPSAFRNLHAYFTSRHIKPIKDDIDLHPEIKTIEKKALVYVRIIAEYGSTKEYDTAWSKLIDYATKKGILSNNSEFIGLSFDDPDITKPHQCRFYACVTTNKTLKPEGEFGTKTIEKGKYAVFTLKGSYSGLNSLYKSVYFNWLPHSEFELRDGTSFEKYVKYDAQTDENKTVTEIYIPIK